MDWVKWLVLPYLFNSSLNIFAFCGCGLHSWKVCIQSPLLLPHRICRYCCFLAVSFLGLSFFSLQSAIKSNMILRLFLFNFASVLLLSRLYPPSRILDCLPLQCLAHFPSSCVPKLLKILGYILAAYCAEKFWPYECSTRSNFG